VTDSTAVTASSTNTSTSDEDSVEIAAPVLSSAATSTVMVA
jgi:hypothetical protein